MNHHHQQNQTAAADVLAMDDPDQQQQFFSRFMMEQQHQQQDQYAYGSYQQQQSSNSPFCYQTTNSNYHHLYPQATSSSPPATMTWTTGNPMLEAHNHNHHTQYHNPQHSFLDTDYSIHSDYPGFGLKREHEDDDIGTAVAIDEDDPLGQLKRIPELTGGDKSATMNLMTPPLSPDCETALIFGSKHQQQQQQQLFQNQNYSGNDLASLGLINSFESTMSASGSIDQTTMISNNLPYGSMTIESSSVSSSPSSSPSPAKSNMKNRSKQNGNSQQKNKSGKSVLKSNGKDLSASPPATTQKQSQKRSAHLSAEFRYRTKLNEKINKLRNLVSKQKHSLSKSAVLTRSIEMIIKLQKLAVHLHTTNVQLQDMLVAARNSHSSHQAIASSLSSSPSSIASSSASSSPEIMTEQQQQQLWLSADLKDLTTATTTTCGTGGKNLTAATINVTEVLKTEPLFDEDEN